MDQNKTATPPATPSRASTMVVDSVERSTPTPTMDMGVSPQADPPGFQPLQMLMQTTISIECGQELETKVTMHEEILRCHSKRLDQLYAKAKPLREQCGKCQRLCKQVARFIFPEMTAKQFEDASSEHDVKPLIICAYEKYPMAEYQTGLQKTIDGAVEEQFAEKINLKPALQGAKKKSPTETRELSLTARLALLKPRGVQVVAEKLFARLYLIKKKEGTRAEKEPVRAAAYQRLLLPDVDETAVRYLVHYIYRGTVHYQGVEQLYAVMELAGRLGVEALFETCLTKLCTAATDNIENAIVNAIPLRSLLGYGPGPTDDVVDVVFKHVIKDPNAPRRLQDLVTDTFAACLDKELWMQVKPLVSHGMAIQVIEAMIDRRQIKTELYDQASIKSESEDPPVVQPSHIG